MCKASGTFSLFGLSIWAEYKDHRERGGRRQIFSWINFHLEQFSDRNIKISNISLHKHEMGARQIFILFRFDCTALCFIVPQHCCRENQHFGALYSKIKHSCATASCGKCPPVNPSTGVQINKLSFSYRSKSLNSHNPLRQCRSRTAP